MQQPKLIVFPAADLAKTTAFFRQVLGAAPYADSPYYVGFKGEDGIEIGIVPAGSGNFDAPVVYFDVADIRQSLEEYTRAGSQTVKDVTDVGYGLLVAVVKDANGSLIGLRQHAANA